MIWLMSHSMLFLFLILLSLASCNPQPTQLSGKNETITVDYIKWACDCPDFVDTKVYDQDPEYEVKEEECFFIEAANKKNQIPEKYYNEDHFQYSLKLTGQFYLDKGVPTSYDRKTPERPKKSRVFRYDSFEMVRR